MARQPEGRGDSAKDAVSDEDGGEDDNIDDSGGGDESPKPFPFWW